MTDFNTYISLTNSVEQTIKQGDPFTFDTMRFMSNMNYANGMVTVNDTGIYMVSWRVNIVNDSLDMPIGNSSVSIMLNGITMLNSGLGESARNGLLAQNGIISLSADDKVELVNTSNFDAMIIHNAGTSAAWSFIRIC